MGRGSVYAPVRAGERRGRGGHRVLRGPHRGVVLAEAPQPPLQQGGVVLDGGDQPLLHVKPHHAFHQRRDARPDADRHGAVGRHQGADNGGLGDHENFRGGVRVARGHGRVRAARAVDGRDDDDFRYAKVQDNADADRQHHPRHEGEPRRAPRRPRLQRRGVPGRQV